jgi:hypothetical protein
MSLQRGESSSPANGPNFENAQRANREILEIDLAGLKIAPAEVFPATVAKMPSLMILNNF